MRTARTPPHRSDRKAAAKGSADTWPSSALSVVFMRTQLTVEAKMGMASRIVSKKSCRMPIVGLGVVGYGGCGCGCGCGGSLVGSNGYFSP